MINPFNHDSELDSTISSEMLPNGGAFFLIFTQHVKKRRIMQFRKCFRLGIMLLNYFE
jgi:hypothetical protein